MALYDDYGFGDSNGDYEWTPETNLSDMYQSDGSSPMSLSDLRSFESGYSPATQTDDYRSSWSDALSNAGYNQGASNFLTNTVLNNQGSGDSSWLGSALSGLSSKLSNPNTLWNIGTGLYNMYNSSKNAKAQQAMMNSIASRADPFGPYRQQYATALSNLYKDPTSFTSNPAYQVALQQSNEAIKRNAAAGGYLGSGNLLTELSNNASNQAYKFYDQEATRLGTLAGASNYGSYGSLAGLMSNASTAGNQGTTQGLYQILTALGMNPSANQNSEVLDKIKSVLSGSTTGVDSSTVTF